jgi:hypothetical protein
MNFGVLDHPFYKPLWRRVAIVMATVAWFCLEVFIAHDGMWMAVA